MSVLKELMPSVVFYEEEAWWINAPNYEDFDGDEDYLEEWNKVIKGLKREFCGMTYKQKLSFGLDCRMTQAWADNCPDYMNDMEAYRKTLLKELQEKSIKRHFKNEVLEQIIQEAMHPKRIANQMNQFDNMEDYFTSYGF